MLVVSFRQRGPKMDKKDDEQMGDVIRINEARIRDHPGEMVRGAVEETLNNMFDAEADQLCGAARYDRNSANLRKKDRTGNQSRYNSADSMPSW